MFKYGLFSILVSVYVGKDMKSNYELCGNYTTDTITASDRAAARMTSQKRA
jgi:hypothetical protein